MKKLILIILLLTTSSGLKAQWFNRAYFNASYGYYNHGELGIYAHVFDHFSAGFNLGSTRIKVGSGSPVPSSGGLFTTYKYHKNAYNSKNFFVGVTTGRSRRFDASFMFGPSFIDAVEYFDFVKKESDNSLAEYYYTAKSRELHSVGLVLRAEALFEIREHSGINISCQQQFNSIRNDFSVVVGINIGLVQDVNGSY